MTPAPAATETRAQVISFVLEPELLGFDLRYVEKVIELPEFSFVPRAPSFVRGAVRVQGKVVAVADLKDFFGMGKVEPTVESRIVVMSSELYNLGLLVDRVERIESVPLRGPLVQTPAPGEMNPYITRIINLGGRILNLVDVEKLLLEIENFFA